MKKYYLSSSAADAYRRWKPTRPIMEDMQDLMDVVASLLDEGMFYTKDVYMGVLPQFCFIEEELARESEKVEGGVIGMEIYYARRRLEEQRLAKKEELARKTLSPIPGKKLGALKFPEMKSTLRNVHIVEAEKGLIIEGAAGNQRKRFNTTCLAVVAAMKRAAQV